MMPTIGLVILSESFCVSGLTDGASTGGIAKLYMSDQQQIFKIKSQLREKKMAS